MSVNKNLGHEGLVDALARLRRLNDDTIRGIVERSASPKLMAQAYDGLLGGLSAVEGRTAMRES